MRNTLKSFLIVIFLAPSVSFSGVLLEPYLGYAISTDGTYQQTGGQEFDLSVSSNFIFGGRIGFEYLGMMMGLDYGASSYKLESTYISTSYEDKVEQNQIGIFVGYTFPTLIRMWGTYYFASTIVGKDSPSAIHLIDSNDKYLGKGYTLGIGFTGVPLFSFNFEFRKFVYDEWKVSDVQQSLSDFSFTEMILSVSMPLNF